MTRKTVSINFLASIVGTWEFDGHDLVSGSAVQVQEPAMPLPAPPAKPSEAEITYKLIDETSYGSIVGLGKSYQDRGEILMQYDMAAKTWSAEIDLD